MKKIILCVSAVSLLATVCSCGSSWNIEGNNMVINKVNTDTIVPAGCYVIYPDSLIKK